MYTLGFVQNMCFFYIFETVYFQMMFTSTHGSSKQFLLKKKSANGEKPTLESESGLRLLLQIYPKLVGIVASETTLATEKWFCSPQ